MKLDFREILKPTAVLFIICVVVSAALAGTNLLTEDRIAQQALQTAEESRKVVLPAADTFESQEGGAYYTGSAGGETVGYVFETGASGYGGTVSVMTGIDVEGTITGVVILSHDETPGLGANAEKPDFLNQYLQPAPEGGLSVIKYQTPGEGQIEAMTGATITSSAVTDAVNQAIAQFYAVKGGA
ncbi:MAG TPA: RnfABCDGE type electron transport complex subunit G [Candidatus Acutalibacter pullicola]|mgnify:FL=1|uniref:Ion-translocating oxidoreductase complex subunit G n=1 Tax=Candidatus Acutalibacter pullicola TaxID=2838417 RepID=A0A9D2MT41_9FIRM|nr:RnfABCDGE type electron transport complex subunit G [Candidatus Acutalibacter pullicola]